MGFPSFGSVHSIPANAQVPMRNRMPRDGIKGINALQYPKQPKKCPGIDLPRIGQSNALKWWVNWTPTTGGTTPYAVCLWRRCRKLCRLHSRQYFL